MTLLLGGILAQLMSDGRFPFVILKKPKQGLKALKEELLCYIFVGFTN